MAGSSLTAVRARVGAGLTAVQTSAKKHQKGIKLAGIVASALTSAALGVVLGVKFNQLSKVAKIGLGVGAGTSAAVAVGIVGGSFISGRRKQPVIHEGKEPLKPQKKSPSLKELPEDEEKKGRGRLGEGFEFLKNHSPFGKKPAAVAPGAEDAPVDGGAPVDGDGTEGKKD